MHPADSPTTGGIFEGFEDYRTPTDEDYRRVLTSGLVVFDANVLLNLYRFNSTTRRDLIAVMQGLGESLWIPHQVMREFWRNREPTLDRISDGPKESLDLLDKASRSAENAVSSWSKKIALNDARKAHLLDTLEAAFQSVRQTISEQAAADAAEHARDTNTDAILDTLASTLANRVGAALSSKDHAAAVTEAQRRIVAQEPPGFLDADKTDDELRAGDYLVWEQLLREAERRGCDALMVTSDVKEDWWCRNKNELRGPRPELAVEFRRRVGYRLLMLTPSELVRRAEALTNVRVNPHSAEDIERVDNARGDALPADVALELITSIFASATTRHLDSLDDQDRSRHLADMLGDPAIGGVLRSHLSPSSTYTWLTDVARQYDHAMKGLGRYPQLVPVRHQTPHEVIAAACGTGWYVKPGSQGLRPYHCLATDGTDHRYVCWGPERSFKDLLFAATSNRSVEPARPAIVILYDEPIKDASRCADAADRAGVDLFFLAQELRVNLDHEA
ncbi:PIN-like domain-containing protein [Lentzea sp. JNUCC 0626]|uniref:PIN-like domain-containing protein n=1 Tax=Lentzea sp. JNUCC 0626 TaxID=3367513 RepID=UPI003748F3B4